MYACFEYTGGRNFNLMSDMAVKNALDSDHERVNLRSSVRGQDGNIETISRFRCFGFVALSRPREGVGGDSAIELYDWEMNAAPVTFKIESKPVLKVTLTDTKRKAVAVKKGDIGSFEMVQTVGASSDDYAQTLFYIEGETDGDGAKQYKLKGLRIDNKKGALSRSLSYDVTDLAFDITMPAGDFEDATIALMNEGNMGISAFDLERYTQDGDKVNVVETLHCDCLRPDNNSVTMQGGGQSATLRKGRQAIYRNDDFDYTTRQRDWVLGEKNLTLKASQSGKNDAWTSRLSERDDKSQYVKTNMLMPGALASFTGTLKIPENWSGDKTLYMRVANISTYANWQGAMANAAGVKASNGFASNAAATQELT